MCALSRNYHYSAVNSGEIIMKTDDSPRVLPPGWQEDLLEFLRVAGA
jgi:hypothetical protein